MYRDRKLVSGYRFRARVINDTGAVAWCKENPQPLHADQEEFVVVPLSKACTDRRRRAPLRPAIESTGPGYKGLALRTAPKHTPFKAHRGHRGPQSHAPAGATGAYAAARSATRGATGGRAAPANSGGAMAR